MWRLPAVRLAPVTPGALLSLRFDPYSAQDEGLLTLRNLS